MPSKVLSWLKKQGYSLEMRVAQTFEQAGFEVSQSQRYLDPGSDELREIDVVASLHRQIDGIDASITLFIECKYSQDKPWVIFTSSRRLDPLFYFSRILHDKYNVYEWKIQKGLQGRLLARILSTLPRDSVDFDFFRMPKSVGYSVVQALGNPDAKDNAYTATMQVSNCVEAHDIGVERSHQETIQDYERMNDTGFGPGTFSIYCSIAFPMIVVQGNLFECYLDSKNEIAISETRESLVVLGSKNRGDESRTKPCTSVVRIVTESDLQVVAEKGHQAAMLLLSQEHAIRELWEYECQKLERTVVEGSPF